MTEKDALLRAFETEMIPKIYGFCRLKMNTVEDAEDLSQEICLEVLRAMDYPGQLNDENLEELRKIGADIAEQPELTDWTEKDTITNYHMAQILMLRRELLQMLPLRTEGKA